MGAWETGVAGRGPAGARDEARVRGDEEARAPRPSRAPVYAAVACLGALVAFALLGSILSVGDRLTALHPVAGAAYYVVVVALAVGGVVYPVARVAAHPVFSLWRLRDASGRARSHRCRLLVEGLEADPDLPAERKAAARACLDAGERAADFLVAFYASDVQPLVDADIKQAARGAFFATAVSQSPLVDAATMLSVNFNLVRAVVERCGFRPTGLALARLYARVMAGALVAGGLEDADLDDVLAGFVGTGGGAKASGVVLASAAQGCVSAFLTYRVGVMTKRLLLAADGPVDLRALRRASYGEALSLMRTSGFFGEVFAAVREKAGQAACAAGSAAKEAAREAASGAVEAARAAASLAGRQARDAAAHVTGGIVSAARDNPLTRLLGPDRRP